MIYRISINTQPEIFQETPMYFWCILGQEKTHEVNCGHGWANSIIDAALEAQQHYKTKISQQNIE